ncbi:hypothetical protein C8Q80DRAFT_735341 [Daedaleopsis nitida]|nr:hypothetical protein C8Q80DRAFT_735341 [Daedaleopsis nitida]
MQQRSSLQAACTQYSWWHPAQVYGHISSPRFSARSAGSKTVFLYKTLPPILTGDLALFAIPGYFWLPSFTSTRPDGRADTRFAILSRAPELGLTQPIVLTPNQSSSRCAQLCRTIVMCPRTPDMSVPSSVGLGAVTRLLRLRRSKTLRLSSIGQASSFKRCTLIGENPPILPDEIGRPADRYRWQYSPSPVLRYTCVLTSSCVVYVT